MRRVPLVIGLLGLMMPLASMPSSADGLRPPKERIYRDGVDAHRRVDVVRVETSNFKWDADPQSVLIKKRAPFRGGDRVIVWFNIDGDARPEGRLVHVIGKRVITRKVHGWRPRGPRVGVRACIEQDTHPFLTSGRRTWGVDIDLRCFNHRDHGRLGDSWAATVRVIAADRYDDAPGPSRWIPRTTTLR